MTTPWLSVIMPIYNGATTLPATLASLEGQTDGIEIIAVNQNSADDSRRVLTAAQDRLPLRIIDNPQGRSWMENTNRGLADAQAPLVTMLHQDDVWTVERAALLRQMHADCPDVDLWVHGAKLIDLSGKTVGRMSPPFGHQPRLVPAAEALSRLIVQNTIALPAAMFRRDAALDGGGLDPALWYTADWDLWLRLAKSGLAWHPQKAAGFRLHATSLTMTGSRDLASFRQQLQIPVDRHLPAVQPNQQARSRKMAMASNAVNIGLAGMHHGHKSGLLSALWACVALGPLNWYAFLVTTQLFQRVLPRLKLTGKKGN